MHKKSRNKLEHELLVLFDKFTRYLSKQHDWIDDVVGMSRVNFEQKLHFL
jgi:hypothetical protein